MRDILDRDKHILVGNDGCRAAGEVDTCCEVSFRGVSIHPVCVCHLHLQVNVERFMIHDSCCIYR